MKVTGVVMSEVLVLFQGIFGIIQMMPPYRSLPLVQDGVGYWYFASAVCQACCILGFQTFFDGIFSTFFVVCHLFCLLMILKKQQDVEGVRLPTCSYSSFGVLHQQVDTSAMEEYWLLRIPFALQASSSTFVLVWALNIVCTFFFTTVMPLSAPLLFQIGMFVACLAWFVGFSANTLLCKEGKPFYPLALVLSWELVS